MWGLRYVSWHHDNPVCTQFGRTALSQPPTFFSKWQAWIVLPVLHPFAVLSICYPSYIFKWASPIPPTPFASSSCSPVWRRSGDTSKEFLWLIRCVVNLFLVVLRCVGNFVDVLCSDFGVVSGLLACVGWSFDQKSGPRCKR